MSDYVRVPWCQGNSRLCIDMRRQVAYRYASLKSWIARNTEVDRPRRPTGYIPTPANANFALGSDALRGQLKVLYLATRWSRGQNPIDRKYRNAMKTP